MFNIFLQFEMKFIEYFLIVRYYNYMDTAIVSNSTWFNQNAADVCEKYTAIASRNFIHIYKNVEENHPKYHSKL